MQSLAGAVLATSPIDPHHLLDSFGLVGLILIIFAECGLLFGFFLVSRLIVTAAIVNATLWTRRSHQRGGSAS